MSSVFTHFSYPQALAVYFLSLRICLFWTFHKNGIIQYVAFCIWVPSVSISCSSFSQVITSVSASIKSIHFYDFVIVNSRADSLEKTLMLGKIEGRKRRGWQRTRWLDGITQWTWVWASSGRCWRTGKPSVLHPMVSQSRTRLSNWTKQ